MAESSPPAEMSPFLAGIGNVCVQWAFLEQNLLFVIGAIEDMPIDKAYLLFAGMDMLPRLKMAIAVTQEAHLPHNRFIRPLQSIQKAIQGGNGLAQDRNMYVHGAHEPGLADGEFVLTMSRWKGDRRHTIVTLAEVTQLGNALAVQAQIAQRVFRDYGVWKFGPDYQHETDKQIARTKAVLRLIRTHQIKRGFKLILANLKPI